MKYRRIKRTLHGSLFVSALIITAWSARQWQLVAEVQEEARTLRGERNVREFRAAPSSGRSTEAKTEPRDATSVIGATPSGPPAGRFSRSEVPAVTDASSVLDDPVLQKLYLEMERTALPGRYAAFVKLLGLGPDDAAWLEEWIFRRNERRLDLDGAARLLRLEGQDAALVQAQVESDAAFRARFVDQFGAQALEVFSEYERVLPIWEFVNRFAGAVALEGAPLEVTQAVSLVGTVAAASAPYQDGGTADPGQVDWPAVAIATEEILSVSQHLSFLNMAPIYRVQGSGGKVPPHP